jgi:hypothetical protein
VRNAAIVLACTLGGLGLGWVAINVSFWIPLVTIGILIVLCLVSATVGSRTVQIQPCIGGWFLELAPLLLPTLALGLSTALDTFALITAPTSTSSGQYQFGFGVVIGAVAAFMGVLAGEPSKLFEQVLEKRFAGKFDPAGTTQQQDAYRAVNEGAYGASAAGNNGVVGWDWGARRERLSQISLALIGRRC